MRVTVNVMYHQIILIKFVYIPLEHVGPSKPNQHWHQNIPPVLEQTPSFKEGENLHGLLQHTPMFPADTESLIRL